MSQDAAVARLVAAAAARFRGLGVGPHLFARTKLARDPIYLDILRDGVLPTRGRLVDIGCGIGLMLSLLHAAREQWARGDWPAGWPPPPALSLHGVELRARIAARARRVLGNIAQIQSADVTESSLPRCEAILIFDVLHLIPAAAQVQLLSSAAAALQPGGVLVVREANPAAGWRFRLVQAGNRGVALLHGRARRRFHFRTIEEWRQALTQVGIDTRIEDHAGRSLFANVALYGRRAGVEELG
jgi:SAM-dependent methyltransferase